jgi:hypothetical protein
MKMGGSARCLVSSTELKTSANYLSKINEQPIGSRSKKKTDPGDEISVADIEMAFIVGEI